MEKKLEVENGYVKYKIPNAIEGMKILAEVRRMNKKQADYNEFDIVSLILEESKGLFVEVNLENGSVTTYEQLIETYDYMESVLMPVCTDVMNSLQMNNAKKKKKSKKQRS